MAVSIVFTAALSYLLGNINGAVLLSRMVAQDDVRKHGSGNAGFTNFFRNYGGLRSLLVILIDGLKAAAACVIGGWLMGRYGMRTEGMLLGGLFATLGHDFPAFLQLKGGKGIVCGFATALVTDWRIGGILFLLFGITYLLTNYVSLASILCAAAFALCFWLFYPHNLWIGLFSLLLAALAIFMHRENLMRLLHGNERKTYFFKKR